jgi:hypothetical protein
VDLDVDSSGRKADLIERIKEHELKNAPSLVKRLGGYNHDIPDDMDENGDGTVTRSEAKAYRKKPTPKKPRTPSSAALKRLQNDRGYKGDGELLEDMDENDDGTVTRSEARKYREMTVQKIKSQLLELGLSTSGLKSELMARLSDALDKMSGANGSPAGGGEGDEPTEDNDDAAEDEADNVSAKESEMGEVVASDASQERTFFPVFLGFAAVLAIIAYHLHNLSQVQPK